MTFMGILVKGGWMMIPILICSIVAIIIVIERILVLSRANLPSDFMGKCKSYLEKEDRQGAIEMCGLYDSPIARVIKEGLTGDEETMNIKANLEVAELERRITALATIVGIAPLLGFLGTVTGMIRAFMRVEQLGGNVNASVLAGGIWEALVTTGAGLAVGIIAYIFYNYIVGRIKGIVQTIQNKSLEVLKWK
ncbi:MotA/TolQ/ExbB proton channel family protein [candidate division WOR-3 bacterium]|nr:MotA/TolQ/ExbB proton channel family protein [candidate division WOR-3 bacterium]